MRILRSVEEELVLSSQVPGLNNFVNYVTRIIHFVYLKDFNPRVLVCWLNVKTRNKITFNIRSIFLLLNV